MNYYQKNMNSPKQLQSSSVGKQGFCICLPLISEWEQPDDLRSGVIFNTCSFLPVPGGVESCMPHRTGYHYYVIQINHFKLIGL